MPDEYLDQSHCPDEQLISQLAIGELAPEARPAVEAHIMKCDSCLEILKEIYRTHSNESVVNELLRILLKTPRGGTK